jgi:hypothetical protein
MVPATKPAASLPGPGGNRQIQPRKPFNYSVKPFCNSRKLEKDCRQPFYCTRKLKSISRKAKSIKRKHQML